MAPIVKEVALTERREDQALTPQDRLAITVQALAENPNVDVDKLERIIELQRKMLADQAKAEFNAAFSRAQSEMEPVKADAENPQTRSRYASYDALDRALRPIYTRYGFALSFGTEDGAPAEQVRVCCDLTHVGGHASHRHLDMPADGKGAKGGDVMTKTHAVGSALSYGQRYLLKLVWNIAVTEDDDGNAAGGRPTPAAPPGYEDWLTDLTATADEGLPALEAAWKASKPQYRAYRTQHQKAAHEALKAKARKVETA
jgi:hypothetical protein